MSDNQYKFQKANPPYQPEPQSNIIDAWGSLVTPYDQESEDGVIGSILIGGLPTFERVKAVMETNDMFILRNRYVWEACERAAGQGQDLDYITVQAALKEMGRLAEIGGPAFLTQLCNATGTHLNAMNYAYTVRLHGIRRRGMALADELKGQCLNLQTGIYVSMAQLAVNFNKWMAELPNTTTVSADQVTSELLYDLENPAEIKPAIMSGLKDYDDLIGGFTPGNVYLFAADTNQGKSSLVQN